MGRSIDDAIDFLSFKRLRREDLFHDETQGRILIRR